MYLHNKELISIVTICNTCNVLMFIGIHTFIYYVLSVKYIKQLLVRNKGLGLFVPKERTIVRK